MDNILIPIISWLPLIAGIMFLILFQSVYKNKPSYVPFFASLISLSSSLIFIFNDIAELRRDISFDYSSIYGGSLSPSYIGLSLSFVAIILSILVIFLSHGYLKKIEASYGEYYVLILCSVLGVVILSYANDFMTFIVAIELMSIPVYILASFNRLSYKSSEAGLKYFILGSFSSAFFLFGISLIFGAVGSVQFDDIHKSFLSFPHASNFTLSSLDLLTAQEILSLTGIIFISIGLLFKIGAFPLHSWVPDVYEGSPTSVISFMSTVVKIGSFIALFHLLTDLFAVSIFKDLIFYILLFASIGSMILGNIGAINQINIKRMLAYSSIAHTGYILVIPLMIIYTLDYDNSFSLDDSVYLITLYLFGYGLSQIGYLSSLLSFSVNYDKEYDHIDDIRGYGRASPFLGFSSFVFIASMAGIPLTVGFSAKFILWKEALSINGFQNIDGIFNIIVIVMIVATVISLSYYLRLGLSLYNEKDRKILDVSHIWSYSFVTFIAVALTISLFFLPSSIINLWSIS